MNNIQSFIDEAVRELQSEEREWLNNFYAQSPSAIRRNELSALPERGVALRTIAQKKFSDALTKAGFKNVIGIWWKVSESLLSCYYVSIDWDSVDSWSVSSGGDTNNLYRINVSKDEYAKAQELYDGKRDGDKDTYSNILLSASVGTAITGAVALIGLILPGHPVLLLPALALGVIAGTGTYVATTPKNTSPLKTAPYSSGRDTAKIDIDRAVSMMISAAKSRNIEIASEWFSNAGKLTLQACGEKS